VALGLSLSLSLCHYSLYDVSCDVGTQRMAGHTVVALGNQPNNKQHVTKATVAFNC